MIVGVKFCGGCNPRHERGKALRAIRGHFGDQIVFINAEEDEPCDVLLYIAGCINRCTDLDRYPARLGRAAVWTPERIEEVISEIEAFFA